MNGHAPLLLVRARPKAGAADRFARWFRQVHLADAAAIPGFTQVRAGRTAAGTWLGIYTFESAESVQVTLASPEAAYARGTWEQWAGELEELQMEMFAPLVPLPIYESRS